MTGDLAPVQTGNGAVTGALQELIREIGDEHAAGIRRPAPFKTGFTILDDVLEGGFHAGDLILVGGAPGVGKTVAALQWARNMAMDGVPVVFVCYEHDERAMFTRLLLQEVGHLPSRDAFSSADRQRRRIIRAVAHGERSMLDEAAADLKLRAGCARVGEYAPRLGLVRGTADTGLSALARLADDVAGTGVLFVDYLQKVPIAGAPSDEERVIAVGEGLKEIAQSRNVALVSVAAGDGFGLAERRLRMRNLRGAAGLAYEADVVLVLNDKFDVVSKAHTAHDAVRAERFRQQVVFTIEKNRDGPAPVDVQFDKDFAHYRFAPAGSPVEERLIDDRLYRE